LAGLLALPLAAGGASRPPIRVLVLVRGDGAVDAKPVARTCRSRCVWRFRRGAVEHLTARPAAERRFVGWSGACSGQSECTIKVTRRRTVVARFGLQALVSWSQHVQCTPVRTSLPEILGSQQNAAGGATEAGGRFQPHLRARAQQHLLNPPCSVDGTPTFVEVHDVVVATQPVPGGDGDLVANLTDPNRSDIASPLMKTLRAEIDGTWFDAKVAPAPLPPVGTHIDVQGFVFWDPGHVDASWHSFSGWELHPLAAWRPAA